LPSTEETLAPNELAEIARARASLSTFLNVHFIALPDAGFIQRLRDAEFMSALESLATMDAGELAHGAALMRGFIASTMSTAPDELAQTLGVDRTKLYRGVSPTYGPPPPCEAVWDQRVTDATAALQALAEIYIAAGMGMAADARERVDYIGVELDFLRVLALRELDAWQSGDPDDARASLDHQAAFVHDHLAQWVPAFVERALTDAQTDFYRGHLTMLRAFILAENDRLQALQEILSERSADWSNDDADLPNDDKV